MNSHFARKQKYKASQQNIYKKASAMNVISAVANIYKVSPKLVFSHSREKASIAEARQTAQYICHVILGLNYTDIAKIFGRDRTTIAHACRRIEDQRDDHVIDQTIGMIGQVVSVTENKYFQNKTCKE